MNVLDISVERLRLLYPDVSTNAVASVHWWLHMPALADDPALLLRLYSLFHLAHAAGNRLTETVAYLTSQTGVLQRIIAKSDAPTDCVCALTNLLTEVEEKLVQNQPL